MTAPFSSCPGFLDGPETPGINGTWKFAGRWLWVSYVKISSATYDSPVFASLGCARGWWRPLRPLCPDQGQLLVPALVVEALHAAPQAQIRPSSSGGAHELCPPRPGEGGWGPFPSWGQPLRIVARTTLGSMLRTRRTRHGPLPLVLPCAAACRGRGIRCSLRSWGLRIALPTMRALKQPRPSSGSEGMEGCICRRY